jgi:hypothetical protein
MNMSATRDEHKLFSDNYEDTLSEYRPLSALAVVAFLFSLLSFTAALSLFYLFVPFIAIVLAIIGFISILMSSRPVQGRTLCTIALCIGLFFVISRVSYEQLRASNLRDEASRITLEWLGYLKRGELYEAHQLTQKYYDREFPGVDLKTHYTVVEYRGDGAQERRMAEDSSPRHAFHTFFDAEPMITITKHAADAEFKCLRTVSQSRGENRKDVLTQEFEMIYEENGQPQSLRFKVKTVREDLGSYFQAQWYITYVQ